MHSGLSTQDFPIAGEVGFEPTDGGSKGRCLTTWRLPIKNVHCESVKNSDANCDVSWKKIFRPRSGGSHSIQAANANYPYFCILKRPLPAVPVDMLADILDG